MNFTEKEYEVASQAVRADRRLRTVRYVITLFAFAFFCFVAVQLLNIRGDNARLQRQIDREASAALVRIEKRIADAVEQNRIQNEETRRFNICMLVIPLDQRTAEVIQGCLEQADLPGGGDLTEQGAGGASATPASAPPSQPSEDEIASSAQPTPPQEPKQQESSQLPPNPTPEPEPPVAPIIQVLQNLLTIPEMFLGGLR